MRQCRWLLAIAAWMACNASAQTLDEQSTFFLAAKCDNLEFERDADSIVVPGQAGPLLAALCSGLPPTGGGGGSSASGGGAGAAASQGSVSAAEAAVRKRRDQLRHGDDADPAATLVDLGKLSAYLTLNYERERHEPTHFEAGRRSDLGGALLGADYRFGVAGAAGIAVTLSKQMGDFDSGAGDFAVRSMGAVVYGSWWVGSNTFVDFNAGWSDRSLDLERIVSLRRQVFGAPGSPPNVVFDAPPAAVASRTSGSEWSAQLQAGYDALLGSLVIGPRVSLSVKENATDALIERGATALALAFDSQEENSLRSALGVQMSRAGTQGRASVTTQCNLDWVHEFRDDQRLLTAHFVEDLRANPVQLRFRDEPPDRDVALLRLGLVAVLPQGITFFANAQALFGHAYLQRSGAMIGLRREF